MRQRRATQGQSTLEYMLVLGVIILAIVAGAAGPIRGAIDNMFSQSGNRVTDAATRFGSAN